MLKRNITNLLEKLLKQFPAVSILGVRQCGKTALAESILPDWRYMDLENPADLAQIAHDPVFFFNEYPDKLIIDEAQLYPELFEVLRGVIDQKRQQKGRFILTGSSHPSLLRQISESLSGRIATVELTPLKANEFYALPLSPFYHLFKEKLNKEFLNTFKEKTPPISNTEMHHVWFYGGYPEPLLEAVNHEAYQRWLAEYRNHYINRDIQRQFPKLNTLNYQRFLSMLASLSGNIINRNEVARALGISESAVRDYLTIAEGTFLWRNLPSYEKTSIKTIVKMPKGYIRDSGLIHAFNKIASFDDLLSHAIVGHSFEGFIIEEILRGIDAAGITNSDAYYFRTRRGVEVDLILEGYYGVLPIEIKHGDTPKLNQLKHLEEFIAREQCPFGLLINQAAKPRWLTPTVFQLPIGWL